jgi:hypothetical protein
MAEGVEGLKRDKTGKNGKKPLAVRPRVTCRSKDRPDADKAFLTRPSSGDLAGCDRAPRSGPLLVDRKDNSVIDRGIDVEADNVLERFSKFGIVRQLECLNSVRSEFSWASRTLIDETISRCSIHGATQLVTGELVGLQDALDRSQDPPLPASGRSIGSFPTGGGPSARLDYLR